MNIFNSFLNDEYDDDFLLDEMPSIKGAIQEYIKDKEEYNEDEGYYDIPRRKQKYNF